MQNIKNVTKFERDLMLVIFFLIFFLSTIAKAQSVFNLNATPERAHFFLESSKDLRLWGAESLFYKDEILEFQENLLVVLAGFGTVQRPIFQLDSYSLILANSKPVQNLTPKANS